MKHKICILLLLLSFAYCSSGFFFVKAYRVEKAIDDIGFVTLGSEEQIEKAEQMYWELSDWERKFVGNYDDLLLARGRLGELEQIVKAAQSAIDALPESITLDSGPALIAASQAYDAARTAVVHDRVAGYDKVYMGIQTYSQLAVERGDQLMQQRRFPEAYQMYEIVWTNFPNSDYGGRAYYGCRDAGVCYADLLYSSGDLKAALDTLNAVEANFVSSEESTALREKINQRLLEQRPGSGEAFHNTIGWGYGELTVLTTIRDVCVKLENMDDPSKYVMFYVRAGDEVLVPVADGSYRFKYAVGENWFDEENLFGDSTLCKMSSSVFLFATYNDSDGMYYPTIQVNIDEMDAAADELIWVDVSDF